MADNGSAQSQDTKMWPLPSFHFKVTLGSVGEISFSDTCTRIRGNHLSRR